MYLELHYQADMEPKNQALDPETLMTIQIAHLVLCDYIMLVIAILNWFTRSSLDSAKCALLIWTHKVIHRRRWFLIICFF